MVQYHLHLVRMTGQRFVDTVIDDLLGQVIGSTGIGVHPWAAPHGIKTTENFNGIGIVLVGQVSPLT